MADLIEILNKIDKQLDKLRQSARATNSEDQKFLDSMKVLNFDAFEAEKFDTYSSWFNSCEKSRSNP